MSLCVLCSSHKDIDERGAYPVCASCRQEQLECASRRDSGTVIDRDTSPLCMRCGLCCVVLSALVEPHEVEKLAKWSGKRPQDIAMVEKVSIPGEGGLALLRPCTFLLGKPTEYVQCRAYTAERPAVCGTYLCKLAVRYKAGVTTLNEALFILRASVTKEGDIGMFNWMPDEQNSDLHIAAVLAARRALETIDVDDDHAMAVHVALFAQTHPRFQFRNPVSEALFAAVMINWEGGRLALDQFFAPELMKGWSKRDQEVALLTAYQVVEDFRDMFKQKSKPEK